MSDISLYLLSIIQNSSFGQKFYKNIRSCRDKEQFLSLVKNYPKLNLSDGKRVMQQLQEYGASFCAYWEENYPILLKEIYDYPLLLFFKGNFSLLHRPAIAIVGARDASISGRDIAAKISDYAASLGFVVVSGLAGGIDRAAHEGAGAKNTIAVIGNGLDVHYPRSNHSLYEDIKREGLLVSEYKLGSKPFAYCFPQRNRIIAGLVKLLVVVEAREKSGSLITCRLALEANREIVAVPGSPLDSRSYGGNKLIADGAHIFTDFADFKELLSDIYNYSDDFNKNSCEKNIASIDEPADQIFGLKAKILNLLTSLPQSQDEIIFHLKGYAISAIIEAQTELQLDGYILRDEQGGFRLKDN